MSTITEKAKAKATYIFSSKPNGREKEYEESIYWGVSKPYANLSDCKKAGIKIVKSKISISGAWYHLNKSEAAQLIEWLMKNQ